MVPIAPSN